MALYSFLWHKSGDVPGLCFVTTDEFNTHSRKPSEHVDEKAPFGHLHWMIQCYDGDNPAHRAITEKLAKTLNESGRPVLPFIDHHNFTEQETREVKLKEQSKTVKEAAAKLELICKRIGE